MSPEIIGLLGILILLVFIILGVHLGVSLAIVGFLGLFLLTGSVRMAFQVVATGTFNKAVLYSLSCVPPCVLMGIILQRSGVTEGL